MAQRLAGLQSRRFVECCGSTSNLGSTAGVPAAERTGRIWPALRTRNHLAAAVFVFPLYVVLCIVFGQVDPLFRTPIPVWNPLQWDPTSSITCSPTSSAPTVSSGRHCCAPRSTSWWPVALPLIAFPVAYYVARLSGKRKGLLLALLIAPFWISYMMRMFAWVNLLQDDGLVNRVLSLAACSPST